MNVTCPSCGADMDLDVLLAHEDSRRALAQLVAISLPLGKRVLQYLRLFKPATRAISHSRTVKLIEQLLPDLQRGAITHKGRDWAGLTTETWNLAIDAVLLQRDKGKLVLPLASHDYLYTVLASMVDLAEAASERETERSKRDQPRTAPNVQPVGAVLQSVPAIAKPSDYSKPSPYAQRLKAEIEAKKRARDEALARPNEEVGNG